MKYVIDTNVLLDDADVIDRYDNIILCSAILEELDGLKKSLDIGYKARQASRKIEENIDKITFVIKDTYESIPSDWNKDLRDNKIVLTAKEEGATVVSNDLNVRLKAKSLGIPFEKASLMECDTYKGFKVIEMNAVEMAEWYQIGKKENLWELHENEYLLIKSKAEDRIVDIWIWTVNGFRHFQTSKVDSPSVGKLKLLDDYQYCALDSFMNNSVTMIKGKPGTGKSLLTVAYAMSIIENSKSKFDKLIVFTNPLATRGSAKLGYYPGTKDEKLLDSQIGNMLASKFGNRQGVERLIQDGKLMLLPFSDIRGFDTTDMKAIIWITEAQNLDIELMRLAIQRIGDDCKLIIDGDYEAQIDCSNFEGSKNGMRRVSEVFRGQEFYGEIELQNVYRSKWADWANKL